MLPRAVAGVDNVQRHIGLDQRLIVVILRVADHGDLNADRGQRPQRVLQAFALGDGAVNRIKRDHGHAQFALGHFKAGVRARAVFKE